MQHDTTNGRTDRRTYLKAIGAGALATGMVAIAGCLGAEAESRNGSGGDGSAADANGAQASGTETDAPIDTAQSTTADGSSAGSPTDEAQSANGCPDASAVDTSQFETHTSSEDGYTIGYPADWEAEILDDMTKGELGLYGPDTERLHLYIEPAEGKTADELTTTYLEEIVEYETDTVEEHCRTNITLSSGQTGVFTKFEIDDAQPGLYKPSGVVFFVVANDTLYQIDSDVSYSGSDPETDQIYKAIIGTFALEGGN